MDRHPAAISRSADQSLFYSWLCLLVWLPLPLGSNRVWAASLFTCVSVILLSLWCVQYLRNRVTTPITFTKAWPLLGLFIASALWVTWQGLSWQGIGGFSLDSSATRQQATLSWGLISFLALALLLLNSQTRLRWTVYTLVISGTFQAVYGSLMTLSGAEYLFFVPKDSYTGVATGTFVNRNHLAGYLVICLSMGLGMMIATLKSEPSGNWRNRLRRWMTALLGKKILLRIALAIMVIGLVLTHSRMGNSSFFIAMMVTGCLALLLSRRASRATVILLSSLLVIDIFLVGTFFGIEKVVDRLETTSSHRETRDEVDIYSIKLLETHLAEGTGAGTFYTSFPKYRGGDIRIFYDHAHNDYLEFLSERGLIGFIPLLLAMVVTFAVAIRAQWKRRNPLMRGLSFGCLMSMIAMGLHATVDFNLQIPANAASFMLVLAFGWISLFYETRSKRSRAG
jgi:O-antigen ligase